jgi:hypothetical protein
MFINEDFPTFERPINAYSGILSLGALVTLLLLIINSADFIFTIKEFSCVEGMQKNRT